MSQSPISSSEALSCLRKTDPVLASLFAWAVPAIVRPNTRYFASLVGAIISQQLSTKAAATILRRFKALFVNRQFPLPAEVLALEESRLRSVGLSSSKVLYLKHLATAFESKTLDFKRVRTMTDEEIIHMLVQVKGVGRWTAEMFLIFSLGRQDIFSFGDLGLRNAVKKLYKLRTDPSPKKLKQVSNLWQPYRTTASLYLWASLDDRQND
jgi:DNA-3-methyladenine glycosylase II